MRSQKKSYRTVNEGDPFNSSYMYHMYQLVTNMYFWSTNMYIKVLVWAIVPE